MRREVRGSPPPAPYRQASPYWSGQWGIGGGGGGGVGTGWDTLTCLHMPSLPSLPFPYACLFSSCLFCLPPSLLPALPIYNIHTYTYFLFLLHIHTYTHLFIHALFFLLHNFAPFGSLPACTLSFLPSSFLFLPPTYVFLNCSYGRTTTVKTSMAYRSRLPADDARHYMFGVGRT